MVIYATADLHGNLPEVPPDADVLLLVGDICPDFSYCGQHERTGLGQSEWLDSIFRTWLDRLVKRGVEVVAIWGNHDFVGEHPRLVPSLPWTLLQDNEVVIKGDIRVYGTPWVPGLPYWAFFASEAVLRARAEAIPAGLDILMTHGPPKGDGDGNHRGEHVGDRFLRTAVLMARPRLTVCGHIHEARGAYDVGGLPLLNVAAVDERYDLHAKPFRRLEELEV